MDTTKPKLTEIERERLRQNAAAMLAWADGQPVEYKQIKGCFWPVDLEWKPVTIDPFHWTCFNFEFRVKPEPPPPVPWDCAADVPGPVCWLKNEHNFQAMIIAIRSTGVFVQGHNMGGWLDWSEISSFWHSTTRADGSWLPCTKPEARP